MLHEFSLILGDGHITDDQCSALFEAGLDDATISTSRGLSRIDVAREAKSLESAIRSAIGQTVAIGLTVARVEILPEQIVSEQTA